MNELFTVVPPRDALAVALSRTVAVARTEHVALDDALGRVLAAPITASETLPAFARSTMDGFAVRALDLFGASASSPAYLRLCGEIAMGRVADVVVGERQLARIHTGAMLPPGADSVIMVEDTNAHGEEIEILDAVAPGENVIAAGEDVHAGEVAVIAGRRLRAQEIGGLAALGVTAIEAVAKPRIAILSTGDEVVAVDRTPELGEVRDVNSATVAAVVRAAGGTPLVRGITGDDEDALFEAMRDALAQSDALVISAGSSVSYRDCTARAIARLGEPGILVHGIAIKPGKPTIVAFAGSQPIIGLPGNPASALVLAWRIVAPLVRRLGGEAVEIETLDRERTAIVTAPVRSRAGREDFVPCTLASDDGVLRATPIFGKSNLIFTLVRADALIVIPIDAAGVAAGTTVRVIVP